jgi:hypothetical protein
MILLPAFGGRAPAAGPGLRAEPGRNHREESLMSARRQAIEVRWDQTRFPAATGGAGW